MKKTRRVRGPSGTKTVGAAGSRSGRLLAFLSLLNTSGRGRRRGVATYPSSRTAHSGTPRYPILEGHVMGSLLR